MTAVQQELRLSVGGAFALHHFSEGQVMSLAAAVATDSTDPVDAALLAAVSQYRPNAVQPRVDDADVDPASVQRRYSLTRVRELTLEDGSVRDVVIMRGQLEAVLKAAGSGREERALVRRNASWAESHGWRPLAVAVAEVGTGDVVGPFQVQGFVSIGEGEATGEVGNGPADWAPVNVWSASLRVQHWTNVVCIFVLSCSGYYIMDPFFGPTANAGTQTGYLMGIIRLIHFTAAFVWIVLGITRLVGAFASRDPHLRWTAWWPLKKKEDVRNLGRVIQHYALIKTEAPLYEGHNPLQQLTYSLLYVGCLFQMIVGLSLFALYKPHTWFWDLVASPANTVGIPIMRLIHTVMMFLIWAFVIMHVYLAFRADSLERQGGVSAMINGRVWLRRGSQPVDGPEVG